MDSSDMAMCHQPHSTSCGSSTASNQVASAIDRAKPIIVALLLHRSLNSLALRLSRFAFQQRIHIALCAAVAAWAWSKVLQVELSRWALFVVSATVLCVYQWNRLSDIREDLINCPPDARSAIKHASRIRYFCAFSFVGILMILLRFGSLVSNSVVLFCLALGYFYSGPIGSHYPSRRLKQFTVVKNLSSAFGWSLITVVYPAMNAHIRVRLQPALLFTIMLAAVGVVELTWDVRDASGDRDAGIRSIPVVYGVRFTELCIFVLNCLSGVLVTIGLRMGWLVHAWVFILLNAILMLISSARVHCNGKVDRSWSNTMVFVQSVLLLGMGLSSNR